MPERRWRVTTGPGRGLFQIDVDDGLGFRPATTTEVDAALRQRELFGAADYPAREVGRDARSGVGLRSIAGVRAEDVETVPIEEPELPLVTSGQVDAALNYVAR